LVYEAACRLLFKVQMDDKISSSYCLSFYLNKFIKRINMSDEEVTSTPNPEKDEFWSVGDVNTVDDEPTWDYDVYSPRKDYIEYLAQWYDVQINIWLNADRDKKLQKYFIIQQYIQRLKQEIDDLRESNRTAPLVGASAEEEEVPAAKDSEIEAIFVKRNRPLLEIIERISNNCKPSLFSDKEIKEAIKEEIEDENRREPLEGALSKESPAGKIPGFVLAYIPTFNENLDEMEKYSTAHPTATGIYTKTVEVKQIPILIRDFFTRQMPNPRKARK